MSNLNWSQASVTLRVDPHSKYQNQVTLIVKAEDLEDLIQKLEKLGAGADPELRLLLPQQWTLFWKKSSGESRILLAHPQEEEWVGTLLLSHHHLEKWSAALKTLRSGSPVFLSHLEDLQRLSNLDIGIVLNPS